MRIMILPAPNDPAPEGAGAPEPQIEITPAMLEAGTWVLSHSDRDWESDYEIVTKIFSAMVAARGDADR